MNYIEIAKATIEAYDGRPEIAIHEALLGYRRAVRDENPEGAEHYGALAAAIAEIG